jgi:hypothetical protein
MSEFLFSSRAQKKEKKEKRGDSPLTGREDAVEPGVGQHRDEGEPVFLEGGTEEESKFIV